MSLSNEYENLITEHLFSKSTLTPPLKYIALSTADPGETGSTIAEPTGSYARVQVLDSQWTVTADTATNNSALQYAAAGSVWGTITHVAMWDHPTNTTASGFIVSASINQAGGKDVETGDVVNIAAGQLDFVMD
jgi:hypothetical protein